MSIPLRVLLVEDVEEDAQRILKMLRDGGYDPAYRRVDDLDTMLSSLTEQTWDIVLADTILSRSGLAAAWLQQEAGLDIPIIILSSSADASEVVLQAGAHLHKHELWRLV